MSNARFGLAVFAAACMGLCGCDSSSEEENNAPTCESCVVETAFQVPIPDAEGTNEQCSNGLNDFHTVNKDGSESTWFDCNNHQCTQSPLVTVCQALENDDVRCSDGVDNAIAGTGSGVSVHKNNAGKSNGLIDCKDPSCFKNPNVTVCANEAPKYEFGLECHDGLDNDGDGLSDCDDPDCLHARASECDLGARVRVLFDNAHHQVAGGVDWIIDVTGRHPFPSMPTKEDDWHGSLSAFGRDLLVSGNYVVETLIQNRHFTHGDATAVQDLTQYDIVVVTEPSSKFTDGEVAAIEKFVNGGGGLLLIADHAGADRDGNGVDAVIAINGLLSRLPGATTENNPFGFIVTDGSMSNGETIVAESAQAHPVINGANGKVEKTGMYGAAAFKIIDATKVTPLLIEKAGADPFAIAATYGTGKIVAIGDSAIFGDGTNHLGIQLSNENGYIDSTRQNRALFLNAMDWLRTK